MLEFKAQMFRCLRTPLDSEIQRAQIRAKTQCLEWVKVDARKYLALVPRSTESVRTLGNWSSI